jgi:hypothetical protein
MDDNLNDDAVGLFASRSIGVHLLRGVVGIALLFLVLKGGLSLVLATSAAIAAVIVMRG